MLDKKFDPKEAESRLYTMWEEAGAFRPRLDFEGADNGRDPYCIVIPPPNVTGSLHMGHAVNNTIQDILIRTARMRGLDVLWQPGMDHAGIATQMVVERQLAASGEPGRKDMSREDFIARVWDWKNTSGGTITQQLRRLGSSCDWSRERFTLDPGMTKAVTKAFVQLYNEGLIYRDKRLVNWDPHFQTAISDLEVENRDVDGHFWHFKYPLEGGETYLYIEKDEDGKTVFEEERDYISIATTRPETMLGDGAVAVHPDDERYASIVGKKVRLPLANRLIPIITDEYPDPDFGSGAVKITGAHDFNDYEVAKRNNIPMYSLMGERGEMIASDIMPEKYVGMDRFEARKAVVADIDAEGLLIKTEDKTVSQPFGDRSGVVIEPMLTDQWFVDAGTMAGPAIAAVDRGHGQSEEAEQGATRFIPEGWKKTYDHWMNNIQPWCISRQLWWGHRIPAWFGPDPTGKTQSWMFVAETEAEAIKLAEKEYDQKVIVVGERDLNVPNIHDPDFGTVEIYRDPDVLDTWFSSGLWPFSTLGWPGETPELAKFYPTSVLVTAFDIIFFWVARMMMMGLHFRDEVPFADIYIHAIVRDEDGKKMSKSEGNVIDPVDLIDGIGIDGLVEKRTKGLRQPEKAPKVAKATRKRYPDGFEAYGADALRFTLAAQAAAGRDIRLSVERVAGYRNFGTKLWNAARFVQINDCTPVEGFAPETCTVAVNQWVLTELSSAARSVSENIDKYRFNDAADSIYQFAWGTYCDWYIELIKPVLNGPDGAEKDETRAAAAFVLDNILKLLHPFMPFITEEIWQNTAKRDVMLILAGWPELDISFDGVGGEIARLIDIVTEIRSVRAEMNVPPSRKAPLIATDMGSEAFYARYSENLAMMGRVSEVMMAESLPEGAIPIIAHETTFGIMAADLIDIKAEKARLTREIDKAKLEITKIDKKLSNQGFLDKAPPAVVEEQRSRREAYASDLSQLDAALGNLI